MTSKELENIMTRDEFDPRQTSMTVTMTGKHNKTWQENIIRCISYLPETQQDNWNIYIGKFFLLTSQLSDTPSKKVNMQTTHS